MSRALLERVRQFPGQERKVYDYYRNNPQLLAELRAPIFEDKTVDYMLELAKVTDTKVTAEQLYADPDARTTTITTMATIMTTIMTTITIITTTTTMTMTTITPQKAGQEEGLTLGRRRYRPFMPSSVWARDPICSRTKRDESEDSRPDLGLKPFHL